MNEKSHAIKNSAPSISEDKHVSVIASMVLSMQADYAEQFRRLYPADDYENFDDKKMNSLRMLKRRLYKLLREFPVECIVDGYEKCANNHPEFLPSVPSIVTYVHAEFEVYKQNLKNQAEIAQLPPPPINQKMSGGEIFSMLREALRAPSGQESGRLERLKAARESHEALIAEHTRLGKIRTGQYSGVLCARCSKPGILSKSITGNGVWFCSEHFNEHA